MGMEDAVTQLADLARKQRVAIIGYRKPRDKQPSHRWVEPYKLLEAEDALVVRCWQLRSDAPDSRDGWRHFRADRISSVEDSGSPFKPRTHITIDTGELHEMTKPPRRQYAGPQQEYAAYVIQIIMDGILTETEYSNALKQQKNMSETQIRAAHAAAYSAFLTALIVDGEISDREQMYIRDVRNALEKLGWAP